MTENTGSLMTLDDIKTIALQKGTALSTDKVTIDFSRIELIDGYTDKADIDFMKIWESFWRSKRLAIFLFLLLSATLVFGNRIILPDTYTATAMISVEVPETENVIVAEELLSTPVLNKVIEKLDLTNPGAKKTKVQRLFGTFGVETEKKKYNKDSIMRDIRHDVNIVPLGQTAEYATRTRQTPVFVLETKDKDPEYVATLLNTILETFIEMKNSGKVDTTIGKIRVLETEISKLDERIVENDKKMTAFRNSHPDYLPEDTLMVELNNLRQQLMAATASNTEENTKIVLLQSQLANIPKTIPVSPGNFNGNTAVLSIQEQLDIKMNEHSSMKSKYKEGNPKLAAIQAEIASLKAELKNGKGVSKGASNPEYVSTLMALNVAKSLVASTAKQMQLLSARIDNMDKRLLASPTISKEIENMAAEKTDLLAKKTDMTQQLSQQKVVFEGATTKLTEFRILQAAETPETPNIRSRLVIYAAALFASMFAGVIIATLYGMMTKITEKEEVKHSIVQTSLFYTASSATLLIIVLFIVYEFIGQSLTIR